MRLWKDESGAIISAELVLVMTILLFAVAVGLSHLAGTIVGELTDIGNAIGAADQTYFVAGYEIVHGANNVNAANTAFGFADRIDAEVSDCAPVTVNREQNIKVDATGGSTNEDAGP